MVSKHFRLIEIETQNPPEPSRVFMQNFQIALLLSLLDKEFLTQSQFDRCVDALER